MSSETTNESASFHDFVSVQLREGPSDLSSEQALALWRERQLTLASLRRGFADLEAGRTHPAQQVLGELREGR